MTKIHNESTLPKWAQDRLNDLRHDLVNTKASMQTQIDNLKSINHILSDENRQWFFLQGPVEDNKWTHLWIIQDNNPRKVITLGKHDELFIGRAK